MGYMGLITRNSQMSSLKLQAWSACCLVDVRLTPPPSNSDYKGSWFIKLGSSYICTIPLLQGVGYT